LAVMVCPFRKSEKRPSNSDSRHASRCCERPADPSHPRPHISQSTYPSLSRMITGGLGLWPIGLYSYRRTEKPVGSPATDVNHLPTKSPRGPEGCTDPGPPEATSWSPEGVVGKTGADRTTVDHFSRPYCRHESSHRHAMPESEGGRARRSHRPHSSARTQ